MWQRSEGLRRAPPHGWLPPVDLARVSRSLRSPCARPSARDAGRASARGAPRDPSGPQPREPEPECRGDLVGRGPDAPTGVLDQALHDRETDAGAAALAVARLLDPV